MLFSGWRLVLVVVAALVVAALLLTALFWLAVLVVGFAALAWFNLLLLPRLARRLHVPQLALVAVLLLLLTGAGFGLGGLAGAAEGAAAWLIGVAVPRVLVWRFSQRLDPRMQAARGRVTVIDVLPAQRTRA